MKLINNTHNIEVFFALLKAGLWEKDINLRPFGEIDFSEVLKIAEEQSVVGLIAAGIENVVDTRPKKKDVVQFIGRTVQLEHRSQAMNSFVGETVEKMRKDGIYSLLLKGQGVARCYERPLLRACGDVDFFLNEDNYEKAKVIMMPFASHVEPEHTSIKHVGMTIDSWNVELHGSLRMGLSQRINRVLDDIQYDTFNCGDVGAWNNGGTQVFLLGAENEVVYVFVHFIKHFYKGGLGLRQICDWCRLLWTFRGTLDVKKVESLINRMGLVKEWKAFASLAVDYLGLDPSVIPMYEEATRWKNKAVRIMDFVMSVGNMGHNRDMSYYSKYPYVIRKCISMSQRGGDLFRHSRIFPLNSLLFFPSIVFYGLRGAINGD